MRYGKQPQARLVHQGGGFRTPLQDMRFEDLANVRGSVPKLSRMPSYPPRKPTKPVCKTNVSRRSRAGFELRRFLLELSGNSHSHRPASAPGILAASLIMIAASVLTIAVLLRFLSAALPYVSPDSFGHPSGVKVYDARAVWGFGLYAITCMIGGMAIMLAWLRSGQN
jgi:hypothetical protein